MKIRILFLLFFVTGHSFSQSVNDYKAVIVPLKFEFLKSDNQYRLATISKFNLGKAGFQAYYSNEALSNEDVDRCSLLDFDVIKDRSFLTTKLYVVLKDCYGKIIFQSETGVSKEKDFELAYREALNEAFASVYALNYKYIGPIKEVNGANKTSLSDGSFVVRPHGVLRTEKKVPVVTEALIQDTGFLYAQPIVSGFQLVDTTPKVVMKVYKTSNAGCFIAEKDNDNGVLISKEGQWYFEYYRNDKLFSEIIAVKF